jgi:hypothetical protein
MSCTCAETNFMDGEGHDPGCPLWRVSSERKRAVPTIIELAEKRLSIRYEEDGKWRIEYTLPRGATIAICNFHNAEMSRAQIRGMLVAFAEGVPHARK